MVHLKNLAKNFNVLHQYYDLRATEEFHYQDSLSRLIDIEVALFQFIEGTIPSQKDRHRVLSSAYPTLEKSIASLLQTASPASHIKAFQIAEQTKSRMLNLQLTIPELRAIYALPASFAQKEDELKKSYSNIQYKKMKYLDSNHPNDKDSLPALQKQLVNLNLQIDELNQELKLKYPAYHNACISPDPFDPKEIQSSLEPNQCILEYFIGQKKIYAFVLSSDSLSAYSLNKDFPLEKWIQQMRESLSLYWLSSQKTDSLFLRSAQQYSSIANQLYQKLIQPLENALSKEVTIVPDQAMYLLPFDALLTAAPTDPSSFKTHDYLLHKHIINYSFSANLNGKINHNKTYTSRENLIAYAPFFKKKTSNSSDLYSLRNDLYYLDHNETEVKQISQIIDGELVTGIQATKESFLSQKHYSKIIHLATHGKTDNDKGDLSYLSFTQLHNSIDETNLMRAHELYHHKIPSDLIVLSACETGIGEVKKGEGVIGLNRAFLTAGARSVLTSLWSINDAKTPKFFQLFYENIKTGMNKDEALHQAKTAYIQQAEAHPFFWSPFVITGDMDPIDFNEFNAYLPIALLLSIFLLIFIYLKSKKYI